MSLWRDFNLMEDGLPTAAVPYYLVEGEGPFWSWLDGAPYQIRMSEQGRIIVPLTRWPSEGAFNHDFGELVLTIARSQAPIVTLYADELDRYPSPGLDASAIPTLPEGYRVFIVKRPVGPAGVLPYWGSRPFTDETGVCLHPGWQFRLARLVGRFRSLPSRFDKLEEDVL
jgi:hypothetical protein